jgi:hypothetical protein
MVLMRVKRKTHSFDELRRYPFVEQSIKGVPRGGGAFVLWEAYELTFVGSSPSIREHLLEYLHGARVCPCQPTHFSWCPGDDPTLIQRRLLYQYSVECLALPRCNCNT